jgi:mono/diheme cytochrome c family protein
MQRSVRVHAAKAGVVAPADLASRAPKGAGDFAEMCVTCHGAPGREPSEIGLGLNPRPPGLGDVASLWSAEELFWIVKNGVRMTGMPAFGPTHDDDRIWSIVAFVRTLPGIDPETYAQATAASADAAAVHDHAPHQHAHDHAGEASQPHDHGHSHDDKH